MDALRTTTPRRSEHSLINDCRVAEKLGCSRATVWRRVADGTLPKPVRIGGMTRFVEAEVDATIERVMAARDELAQ